MWKAIEGYEGYYEVSDFGEVRSLDRVVKDARGAFIGKAHSLKGQIMKQTPRIDKNRHNDIGYLVVNLRKDAQAHVVPVHILVANAFIPNPNNYPVINHIDGNKHNNHVSNLERCTYGYNNIHALANGLRHPRGNAIGQYDDCGNLIATYRSTCEATRQTGISTGSISHCLNGRTFHAGGFVWRKMSESQTTIPKGSTPGDELPAEAPGLLNYE